MSDDLRKKIKALKSRKPDRSYAVGYGKPPEASRFKKGKSGNPKGRPRGSKNKMPALNEERLRGIILEEAYREIKVKDGAKEVSVPIAQAVMRSIAVNAVRGDQRSQKIFTDLVNTTEAKNKQAHDEFLQAMIDYKLSKEEEIRYCKRIGLEPPDPVPHPDHIKIDLDTGQVRITGPFTQEEKVKWDKVRKRKAAALEAIKSCEEEKQTASDEKFIKFLDDEIAFEKMIFEMLSKAVPD